jgi:hypothetical protein
MRYRDCFAPLRVARNDDYGRPSLTANRKPLTAARIIYGIIISLFFFTQAWADYKQWSGKYDAVSWSKDGNWFSSGIPTLSDNTTVNTTAANVVISNVFGGFKAKDLAVGGRADSTVTAENFVYGFIEPASGTDNALLIRKGGLVVLQGAGVITLKGKFKNSEETIPDEPALMFGAE